MSKGATSVVVDHASLFEQLPSAMLVVRPDAPHFTIAAVTNAYLQSTMTTRDIVGRALFDVFPDNPDDPAADGEKNLRASLARVLETKQPHSMAIQRYDVRRPDGGSFETRHWAPTNAPIFDATGNIALIAHRVDDVTERVVAERLKQEMTEQLHRQRRALEEANRALAESNRELEGFSASVSHDLRAPLRAVDGFAKILLEDHAAALGDEGQRVAGVICKNTQRMKRLIDDLLAFSRLGRQPMEKTTLDMDALARETADELSDRTRAIDLHIDPLPKAYGDMALMRQVWRNLLSNALKYSAPRSPARIRVSGRIEDGAAVYRIEDNGVGFDPRYVDKLFRVFQRLHTEAEFDGTGVGLALVHRILRRHDGWITAVGRLNEGATFTFGLHAYEAADERPR